MTKKIEKKKKNELTWLRLQLYLVKANIKTFSLEAYLIVHFEQIIFMCFVFKIINRLGK